MAQDTRTGTTVSVDTRTGTVVGVDTGGTFTDVVLRGADGSLHVHKLLSTPDDPSRAIGEGFSAVVDASGLSAAGLVHGTTVATNALLERKGARLGLITTAGFEDLLRLRRQHRPALYAFDIELAPPLVSPGDVHGVSERLGYDGRVLEPLTEEAVAAAVDWVGERGLEAVAICLLHAYARPDHERRLAEAIARAHPDVHVSASFEVVREFREYERASTTAVNGFVGPVMARYLRALESRLEAVGDDGPDDPSLRIEVLQSSGGRSDLDHAARLPVHTVLSGPAGGVVGALAAAGEVGIDRIISFDMGGTSTDVSLCDGAVGLTTEADIGGLPIRVPVIDIHTVGAGGGSVARVDPGGALRVGPESAGADPGPACYGRGGSQPTVTDAHLVLGRLRPDQFLGGQMALDADAASRAVARLADALDLAADVAAEGVLEVADAAMVRAIKVISLEKGHDPRDFTLVSFGGAGGLHACRLAERLGMRQVLVPRAPGLLSAYGMLHADPQRLYSATVLGPLDALLCAGAPKVREVLAELAEAAVADLGAGADRVEIAVTADLRYAGQSFEIGVPVDWRADAPALEDPTEAFEARHETLYGYRASGRPVELVAIRLQAVVAAGAPAGAAAAPAQGAADGAAGAPATSASVGFDTGRHHAQVVGRASLAEGDRLVGPAIVTEYSGTTVVPPGWGVRVACGHLVVDRQE